MKPGKKIAAGLKRRQAVFTPKGPNQQNKHLAHMPGSQNRKKGYGVR